MMVPRSVRDAAGFLEGEGSFGYYGSPRVSAAQVQKEPLDRLLDLFGGRIWRRTTMGFSAKPIWVWQPSARQSIGVMMTLFSFMSPKRQDEIKCVLEKWKLARLMPTPLSGMCGRGHKMEPHGSRMICPLCRNAARRAYRARTRPFCGKIHEV